MEVDMVRNERCDERENCSDSSCRSVVLDNGPVEGRRCHWDLHQEERRAVFGIAVVTGRRTWIGKGARGCEGRIDGTGPGWWWWWWWWEEVATEFGLIRSS